MQNAGALLVHFLNWNCRNKCRKIRNIIWESRGAESCGGATWLDIQYGTTLRFRANWTSCVCVCVCVCVCDVIQMELLAINRLAMQFISSSAAIQWRPQVKGHSRRTRRKGHLLITIILHQVESKINSIITFNLPTLIRWSHSVESHL